MIEVNSRQHRGALLPRFASALAIIATLTGSVVVSCSGDPNGENGDPDNAPLSASMGRWTPAAQDTCTKAFHDTFFVIGPDGKKYPTWHAPRETDPATNQLCSFGHDHGPDPRNSSLWTKLQTHFAFDANNNGSIDASELEVSGIPFGLVSERLVGSTTPRLEEHTAYKVAFANALPRSRVSGGTGQAFTVNCDLFAAYNQATSTPDAFGSNMFSVIYGVNCTGNAQYPVEAIVSAMAVYGDPGEFTLANGTPQTTVDAVPPTSPQGGSEQGRLIPTSDNVWDDAFVLANEPSSFNALFERWETQLRLRLPNNNAELATFSPAFRVEDTPRYYRLDINQSANSVDLCYSGLNAAGAFSTDPASIVRQVRSPSKCTAIAPNGPSTQPGQRVAVDDPDSPFKGCARNAFFGSEVIRNPTGTTTWYTDAFGANANPVAFANSVKQFIRQGDTGTVVVNEVGVPNACPDSALVHVPN